MPWEQDYSFPPQLWHSSGFTKAGKARSCLCEQSYRANLHHCWWWWVLPALLCQWPHPAEAAQVPPLIPSTVTVEEPFVAQYGHTIFPNLGTYRISPFFSEPPFPSLKADSLDAVALLVSVFQACNPSCQERVLARPPWVMPYPFPAPRLWTSFSFPLSNQTFTVEELGMDSPSLCCPRGRASAGGNLQCLLQKRFLASF